MRLAVVFFGEYTPVKLLMAGETKEISCQRTKGLSLLQFDTYPYPSRDLSDSVSNGNPTRLGGKWADAIFFYASRIVPHTHSMDVHM